MKIESHSCDGESGCLLCKLGVPRGPRLRAAIKAQLDGEGAV